MKLLFIHRNNEVFLNSNHRRGAGYIDALQRAGVEVVSRRADEVGEDLADFDFVYLWQANGPEWALPAAYEAWRQGTRLLVVPIWWSRDLRESYFGRTLYPSYESDVATILEMAECLHVRAMSEAVECWKLAPGAQVFHLGAGAWPPVVESQPAATPGYVLSLGRIERHKNQHNLALACRSLGIPLVCVGRWGDQSYAARAQAAGAQLMEYLPHQEAMEMLARARVHALPSFGEVVSLANQEACALGVPGVMSYMGAEPEFFGAGGIYCDPTNVADIARAVGEAWNRPRGVWVNMPTWDEIAERGVGWMEENK